jgi:hypothetical protein
MLLHPAFRPRRQRVVAQLTQLFDPPPFRRISFLTIARRILDHG